MIQMQQVLSDGASDQMQQYKDRHSRTSTKQRTCHLSTIFSRCVRMKQIAEKKRRIKLLFQQLINLLLCLPENFRTLNTKKSGDLWM